MSMLLPCNFKKTNSLPGCCCARECIYLTELQRKVSIYVMYECVYTLTKRCEILEQSHLNNITHKKNICRKLDYAFNYCMF